MFTIKNDYTQIGSGSMLASSASTATMQNQIDKLKMQCANWQGCTTTSVSDKQKIVANLSQQIESLQLKMDKLQQPQPASATHDIDNKIPAQNYANNFTAGDGINRPVTGAESGSVINISV